jgi:DNA-binding NarL/FixJ family response regulator
VRAGARGWVSQATSFEHLLRVIHGVSRGETWIPPRLVSGLLDSLLSAEETRQQESEVLALLSARETEVLNCLAQGLTRQEIAQRYFLSPHTVRTHINNVLRKLDVHSTLAAVSIARRIGLPNPDFD